MDPEETRPPRVEDLKPTSEELEYLDPTPDVRQLFDSFNNKYFWGKLENIELKWSNKMTSCAGLCIFRSKPGFCTIKLSAPLLSLRPRKDLVQTLLHEMIHAYLFLTENFDNAEDHGPEFVKHMERINKEAGTDINLYHRFVNEVEFYRAFMWRCRGPCRTQGPYFGIVRRSENRRPGPSDFWWEAHSQKCGGVFKKIVHNGQRVKNKKDFEKAKNREDMMGSKHIPEFFRGYGPEDPSTSKEDKESQSSASTSTTTDAEADKKGECSKSIQKSEGSAGSSDIFEAVPSTSQAGINNYGNAAGGQKGANQTFGKGKGKKRGRANIPAPQDRYDEDEMEMEFEPKKMIVPCPMCGKPFEEDVINIHVNVCLEEEHPPEPLGENQPMQNIGYVGCYEDLLKCSLCGEELYRSEFDEHLESCFEYTFQSQNPAPDDEPEEDKVQCPCCHKIVSGSIINEHIDDCLTLKSLKKDPEYAYF